MSVKSISTPMQPIRQMRAVARSGKGIQSRRILLTSSLLVLSFIAATAVMPAWFVTHSPTEMSTSILRSPGADYWLGTDLYGRDIYSLLVYGSRQSLLIGIGSVLIGGLIGSVIGLAAGYRGGWLDSLLMRFVDMMMTVPGILLAILLSATFGPSLQNMIIAVGLSTFPGYARMIRSQVLTVTSAPFIDAARTIGVGHYAMLRRHIVPNCLPPLIVMATIGTGTAILISTGLSFLGLGVVREIPDWGYLLSLGRSYLSVAWWISLFPGMFISILVIAVNLLGDELRNMLEPRKG